MATRREENVNVLKPSAYNSHVACFPREAAGPWRTPPLEERQLWKGSLDITADAHDHSSMVVGARAKQETKRKDRKTEHRE